MNVMLRSLIKYYLLLALSLSLLTVYINLLSVNKLICFLVLFSIRAIYHFGDDRRINFIEENRRREEENKKRDDVLL